MIYQFNRIWSYIGNGTVEQFFFQIFNLHYLAAKQPKAFISRFSTHAFFRCFFYISCWVQRIYKDASHLQLTGDCWRLQSTWIITIEMFVFEIENQQMNTLNNCSALESPSQQKAQSLLIIITKPDDTYTNFQEQVRLYNKKPPFNFARPGIFHDFVPVNHS